MYLNSATRPAYVLCSVICGSFAPVAETSPVNHQISGVIRICKGHKHNSLGGGFMFLSLVFAFLDGVEFVLGSTSSPRQVKDGYSRARTVENRCPGGGAPHRPGKFRATNGMGAILSLLLFHSKHS